MRKEKNFEISEPTSSCGAEPYISGHDMRSHAHEMMTWWISPVSKHRSLFQTHKCLRSIKSSPTHSYAQKLPILSSIHSKKRHPTLADTADTRTWESKPRAKRKFALVSCGAKIIVIVRPYRVLTKKAVPKIETASCTRTYKVLTVSAEKVAQNRPGIGFFGDGSDQPKNPCKT